MRKITDEIILESYSRLKSVWGVAGEVDLSGQSIHKRLQKLGIKIDGSGKKWTRNDNDFLAKNYTNYRDKRTLSVLADKMGRTKHFICRKARELGLTDISRKYSHHKRTITSGGYVYIGHTGLEHRLVMAETLGRDLSRRETVHHKDEDRTNNSPENLELMDIGEHLRMHNSGEKSVHSKLTRFKAARAREFYVAGVLRSEIAKLMNVTWGAINSVVQGKTWIVEQRNDGAMLPGQ